jgi:hypothetical protein
MADADHEVRNVLHTDSISCSLVVDFVGILF